MMILRDAFCQQVYNNTHSDKPAPRSPAQLRHCLVIIVSLKTSFVAHLAGSQYFSPFFSRFRRSRTTLPNHYLRLEWQSDADPNSYAISSLPLATPVGDPNRTPMAGNSSGGLGCCGGDSHCATLKVAAVLLLLVADAVQSVEESQVLSREGEWLIKFLGERKTWLRFLRFGLSRESKRFLGLVRFGHDVGRERKRWWLFCIGHGDGRLPDRRLVASGFGHGETAVDARYQAKTKKS